MKNTAYLIQGTIVSLWWLGLLFNDRFYQAFQFPEISPLAFNSFFFPDLVIITVLSIIRSYKKVKDFEFIILGGFAYGALYCINATILSSSGYLPTLLMSLGLFYNIF